MLSYKTLKSRTQVGIHPAKFMKSVSVERPYFFIRQQVDINHVWSDAISEVLKSMLLVLCTITKVLYALVLDQFPYIWMIFSFLSTIPCYMCDFYACTQRIGLSGLIHKLISKAVYQTRKGPEGCVFFNLCIPDSGQKPGRRSREEVWGKSLTDLVLAGLHRLCA